jgi:hypothetical protein
MRFKYEVLASYNKMIYNPDNDRFFTVELISKYQDVNLNQTGRKK